MLNIEVSEVIDATHYMLSEKSETSFLDVSCKDSAYSIVDKKNSYIFGTLRCR